MNQEKIGKFILEMRKQKGLTQKELAEMIGISDKTISKWECGNSMPDISYLEALCSSLGISVNELLSGERLSGESYSEKAEENIMALMKENENNKKEGLGKSIFGILLAFASVTFLMVAFDGLEGLRIWRYYYDGVGVIAFLLLSLACVLLSGKKTKAEILRVLQKTSIPNGILLAVFQFVITLRRLDNLAAIGPNVAILTLVALYGIATYLVATLLLERVKVE